MDIHSDLEKIEQELGIKIYPGTEVQRDVAGIKFAKSKQGVLVPQPSNEREDPLNWNFFWKQGALWSAIFLGFVQGFGPLAISAQFPALIQKYDASIEEVIRFTGVAILVLGFSNFVWVPIATQFGRRPAALLSSAIALGSCIWRGYATTYGSYMGACVLSGIGCGPAETLPPMVIADVVFIEHRGFWNACYWFFYFGSLMIGPIIAGAMTDSYGQETFWWLNAALFAWLIVFIFFLMPETQFKRANLSSSSVRENGVDAEKGSHGGVIVEEHIDEHVGKGRPIRWQFLPIKLPEWDRQQLWRDVFIPWYLFLLPIVEWASFSVSWSCSNFLVLNLTQSFVFAAPPYNFSAQSVGFTNFAVFAGALVGLATGGPISDWLSLWRTKRNGMIREPEFRLPVLWFCCIILTIGTTICAVGYQNQWSWKTIIILGYSFVGYQVATIPALCISYAIDSYKPVAGEFLVTMTVNKNLWGYGVAEFLIPWIVKDGFIPPMITNLALTLAFTLLGSIVLFFCGKTVRGWSKNSMIHRLK